MDTWFQFILCSLAVWRVTHLFGKEDGPFDIIFLIRKKAGAGFWGSLLDCFYCLSMWTALPFAFWIGANWKEVLVFWLALSGMACLLEQATSSKSNHNHLPEYSED